MIYGENTTVIIYEFRREELPQNGGAQPSPSMLFEVRPLVACRDYHSLGHENGAFNKELQVDNNLATISPYQDAPPIRFAHDADEVHPSGYWYRDFEYMRERERGFDFTEDLFNPFVLEFDAGRRSTFGVIVSTVTPDINHIEELKNQEIARRAKVAEKPPPDGEFVQTLSIAADQFIARRGQHKTIIAGYHWFSDWGRDTMIALPGLALTTGRADVACSILLEFARHVDRGMVPNRFPDAGEEPEYNTVDASLWFFEAVRALYSHTNDDTFVRKNLYDVLADIIDWHVRGTRYNIHVDEDGLLASGADGVQLTWMDAKVGDWVITPRRGKPVEIQALWYNALRIMENLAARFADIERQKRCGDLAARAHASFGAMFWNESLGCLYDVVDGELRDASIRPNQIFAVSLPHTMLSREKAQRVIQRVKGDLLTPYGLRSLARSDPQYRGRYEGDAIHRDAAYHQGTVWAWLIGPFITAYLKAFGRTQAVQREAASFLSQFREHLTEAGLGQVSEIFDGDPPHEPRGCIAQAWSVAEVLRATLEVHNLTSRDGNS